MAKAKGIARKTASFDSKRKAAGAPAQDDSDASSDGGSADSGMYDAVDRFHGLHRGEGSAGAQQAQQKGARGKTAVKLTGKAGKVVASRPGGARFVADAGTSLETSTLWDGHLSVR
jgi:hypothetical protein